MKIETTKDKAQKKALNKPHRSISLAGLETELDSTDHSYLQDTIDEHRKKLELHTYDRDIEEPRLRDDLVKRGILQVSKDGSMVRDARIQPREEKKLVEFASRLTEGDRGLVIELAGEDVTVYRKSTGDADKPEIVELAEFTPKRKQVVEKGD